ncbi:MAG: hypothetical protein Q7S98_03295, partial [Deltaproteobacteria bacterium]|nr:hypothetical protein [Deltaproteobacteria bacterium]
GRTLSEEGKNKIVIDGKSAPLSTLQKVSQGLIDLATQHENQSLLQSERHREILDAFGIFEKEKAIYQDGYRNCFELTEKKKKFLQKVEETRKEEDFLQFQLQEIREARLEEGEEESLLQEREVAKHAVRLGQSLERIESSLLADGEGSIDRLSSFIKELQGIALIDPKLKTFLQNGETALSLLQETANGLRRYGEGLRFDPERLQVIEERLDLLKKLKKKHGNFVQEVLKKERELKEDLDRLENFDQMLKGLENQLVAAEEGLKKTALVLRKKRREAAARLGDLVEKELSTLGMAKVQFVASVEPLTTGPLQVGEDFFEQEGAESVEFLMAPNPGEGIRPMARIASGGELARILLALKTILGGAREVGSYLFDEVDTGIGGAASEAVGRSLKRLSQKTQVITITHLPQIACLADHHFVIRKEVQKGRTMTSVLALDRKGREEEIARMLGGFQITDKVRAHAKELLQGEREKRASA